RVATLVNLANPIHTLYLKEMKLAASAMGIMLESIEVRVPDELDGAFDALTKERPGALIVLPDAAFYSQRPKIMSLALKDRPGGMFPLWRLWGGGWPLFFGADFSRIFPTRSHFGQKDPKGYEPRRDSRRGAHAIRAGHQSQHR